MNRVFFAALGVLAVLSSCQSSKVKITGRFVGSQADMVYLEQVTTLEQTVIDSIRLGADGDFALKIDKAPATPSLYNIVYDSERIPLLIQGGDHITVNSVGSVLRNYTVEGSLESELLQKFYKRYAEGVMAMNDVVARFTAADLDAAERDTLTKRYTELYRDIKREQLRFIVENKDRIAAVYALYQRLPGDAYLFNGDSDLIYYRTVAEGIEQNYPESPYLPILRSQISRMDAQISLLSQVKLTDFPEISMPDMYGNDVKLSSLEGKVILLHFWSAALGNGNAINADLKTIYEKYHDLGFEIYQVAVDTSKAAWVNAIQEQQLPWISVSDLQGNASPSLSVYNVKKLPSNYLIDREGNIVGKDLSGEKLEEAVREYIRE
ncbi:MAG: AhpC/TSA family protein [Alistipes sp.]|nr:AhpC/TSA family protein [Alistipes sp.]